jgi:hypothetical protein
MASGWKARRTSLAASIHGDDVEVGAAGPAQTFGPYDFDKVSAMLTAIRASGATVSGDNPWDIDPNAHGIKLHADWDHDSHMVTVTVVSKPFYVSNDQIWNKISPMMPHA